MRRSVRLFPLPLLFAGLLGVGCVTTSGPAPTTGRGKTSPAETLAAASRAEEQGQTIRALDLYLAVVHDAGAGRGELAEALWRASLLRLGPGETHDVAAAEKLLAELGGAKPDKARASELAAVEALLGDLAAVRAEVASLSGELAAAKTAAKAGGGDAELKRLKTDLAQAKTDLAEAQAEIARKEEALRKIKETLVGKKDG